MYAMLYQELDDLLFSTGQVGCGGRHIVEKAIASVHAPNDVVAQRKDVRLVVMNDHDVLGKDIELGVGYQDPDFQDSVPVHHLLMQFSESG